MTTTLRIAGVAVTVNRHPGARRLILRASRIDGRVTVTAPARASQRSIRQFLDSHADWIRARADAAPDPVPFTPGAIVPLRGIPHRIDHGEGKVRVDNGMITGPDGAAIEKWLREQARTDLTARSFAHADALGLRPRRIAIRDQRTRWGSCSVNGTLSFNWRLVLAPAPVLDYLAAHEVAHLREMNHAPAFWSLVGRLMPDYDTHRAWLRTHGPGLHRYGGTVAT